jgi:hypothetical protein
MYCNGLLANLNARSYLRDAMDNDCELLSVSGFRSTTGTTLGKSQVSHDRISNRLYYNYTVRFLALKLNHDPL